MGALDLPDQPDEPKRAEHAGDRLAPSSRELPDPDERDRAYEAIRAHVSAETGERTEHVAGPDRQAERTDQRSYWDEVPQFLDTWADHAERWPTRPRPAAEPERSEGHAETARAIGRVREAERPLSADVETIAGENTCRGWLEGFEFRLKREDRLKEKIAEGLTTTSPDATPHQVLRLIPDAIRYTYCFQPDSYANAYYDIKERLEDRGYEMYYSKNYWTNPEYKGINTRWVTADGQRFEVQFHTPESFHAKHHVTHTAYERIRDPATSRAELRELHAFQREVCSRIRVPDGAADIPDYRKEGF